MKYIAITFDDGREDTYSVAYPILKKCALPATLFCTTGYVDGTWNETGNWYSAERPISVDQLIELKGNGWEIALHGDKHITDLDDTEISIDKIKNWGLFDKAIGFSIPGSNGSEESLNRIVECKFPNEIQYIRGGRKIDTRTLSARVLFGLYSVLGFQAAYNVFNRSNVSKIDNIDPRYIYSVVVRLSDRPQMILNFIDSLPDDSVIVFMFHSIHQDNKICKKDPWNWSESKFNYFCESLKNNKSYSVKTLSHFVKESGKI